MTTMTTPIKHTSEFDIPLGVELLTDPQTGVTITIEDVTPERARHWLEFHNPSNRSKSKGYVNRYARDMAAGRWHLTPNGLSFDDEGNMTDGQHRLTGIIDSNTTQRFIIVRGLSAESKRATDTGKARTFANYLQIEGYGSGLANDLAAAVSYAMKYERAKSTGMSVATNAKWNQNFSIDERYDWLEAHNEMVHIVAWVHEQNPPKRKGISAPMLSALIYNAKGLREEARDFVQKYSTGAGMQEGDAALTFRNLVEALNTKVEKREEVWYQAILNKSFNAHARGERPTRGYFAYTYDGNGHKGLKRVDKFPFVITGGELV